MKVNPMTVCDYYKLGHMTMDVPGVEQVVSTWTPRHHKHDPDNKYTVSFGAQYVVKRWLQEFFQEFFNGDIEWYVKDFTRKIENTFNPIYIPSIVSSFRELHSLGYLPIEVWSLPEGLLVPDGCPQCMIFNTNINFGWLPQFLEDLWSVNSWLPNTSATTAYYRRVNATPYFQYSTDSPEMVRSLCGDFSMRGMTHHEVAAISGAAHLLSFDRTATIDANSILEQYYGADLEKDPPGFGTPSLEHSVVEKGIAYFENKILDGSLLDSKYSEYIKKAFYENWEVKLIAEMCFLIYLLTEVQPEGVFTYVADTNDYWGVIGKVLPLIKSIIMNRRGKLVIRPDSGDPVKVILGDKDSNNDLERSGTVRQLLQLFGIEKNGKDYYEFNSCIGLIYGDAITAERQEEILEGLEKMRVSPLCINLGIGAFTYQYATRDTRGYAIKAVSCTIDGIGEIPIFKSPKTDTSKSSQRGAVVVKHQLSMEESWTNLTWEDGLQLEEALSYPYQIMQPIFKDGVCYNQETIYEIRDRLWNGKF